MYKVTKMYGKPVGGNRWGVIDHVTNTVYDVYTKYQKAYAILTNNFVQGELSLDMDLMRSELGDYRFNFDTWLNGIGSRALPTTTKVPSIELKTARYRDAFRAGYKVIPTDMRVAPDAELPVGAKPDLFLKKDDIDMQQVIDHCMVSVNGFFHYLTGNGNGAWVRDAMASKWLSGQAGIGILSFKDLGVLKYIDITPDMVYKQIPTQPFSERTYIDLGVDTTGKTVILVIGGYMHLLDGRIIKRVSDSSLCVNVQGLHLEERFHESMKYVDLSSLVHDDSFYNKAALNIGNFYSDENIKAYMALSQTFAVLLDNDEIFVDKSPLQRTPFPSMMISHEKPLYPLVTGLGRVTEYWDVEEDGQWSVVSFDADYHRYAHRDAVQSSTSVITDARDSQLPVTNSHGYFMKISSNFRV